MPHYSIKRGDTRPALLATLSTAAGAPLDLESLQTAMLHLRQGETLLSRNMTIMEPRTSGQVRYDWMADDWLSLVPGVAAIEFELTYQDGNVLTVPTRGYASIQIHEDLA